MSWLNWIGLGVGIVGIGLSFWLRRFGLVLVFASLVLVSIWNDNMTFVRWLIFWFGFLASIAASVGANDDRRPIGARWRVRRTRFGFGILQFLLALVLASGWEINHPFEGWGWLMFIIILLVAYFF